MNMLQRMKVLLPAAALTAAIAGCGGPSGPAPALKTTPVPAAAAVSPGAPSPAGYPGSLEGDTYTNGAFGLTFRAPAGWYLLDAAAYAEAADLVEEGDHFPEQLEELEAENGSFVDLYAASETTDSYITVTLQNLDALCGRAVAEEEIRDVLLKEMDPSKMQELADIGWDVTMTPTATEFCGRERNTLDITIRCALELDGADLDMTCYERQIYLKSGEYAALISVSTCSEEELTELIGCFSME